MPEVARPERTNTPPSIPLASDEQKNKTVERCLLSPVQDRPKSSWRMRFEICNCHLTTGDKGGDRGEDAERNQTPTEQFNKSCDEPLGIVNLDFSAKCAEQFLRSMASE